MRPFVTSVRAGLDARPRRILVDAVHLLALAALAVAQPTFDLLGRNATFFVARGSSATDVMLLIAVLLFGVPLILLAVQGILALVSSRACHAAQVLGVGVLSAIALLPFVGAVLPFGRIGVVVYVVAGSVGAAWAYLEFDGFRQSLTVLGFAPVVLVALFLWGTPVSKVVFHSGDEALAAVDETGAPVVMVVFDELPQASLLDSEGRIAADRFPNFAELANDATWFRQTTASAPSTQTIVPAILTGRQPAGDELPIAADHPQNLFTMLGRNRRANVYESITRLCPRSLCSQTADAGAVPGDVSLLLEDASIAYLHAILPDSWRSALPSIDGRWGNFREELAPVEVGEGEIRQEELDERLVEDKLTDQDVRLQAFIDGIEGGSPSLNYLHLLLPHHPRNRLPSGLAYNPGEEPGYHRATKSWDHDPLLVEEARQRHLLAVGFADRALGRIADRLKTRGLYESALIVVVADHGVNFTPGGPRRTITPETAQEILSVPLIVKQPFQKEGAVSDVEMRSIDVLPTIADALEIALPWPMDGRSGFEPPERRRELVTIGDDLEQFDLSFEADVQVAQRIESHFGEPGQDFDLFGAGEFRHLVGTQPSAHPGCSEALGMEAEVDDAELLASVDLSGGFIPAKVSGELRGSGRGRGPVNLVASLNGTIAGTGRSYGGDSSDARFYVFVADELFHAGENDLRLYVPEADGGTVCLHTVEIPQSAAE